MKFVFPKTTVMWLYHNIVQMSKMLWKKNKPQANEAELLFRLQHWRQAKLFDEKNITFYNKQFL